MVKSAGNGEVKAKSDLLTRVLHYFSVAWIATPCPFQIFFSSPKVPFVQIQKSNLCTCVRSEVKILLQIFWSVNKKHNRPSHKCSYCSYSLYDMTEPLVTRILFIHLYGQIPYLGSSLDWEQIRRKKMEQLYWISWRKRSGPGCSKLG